MSTISLQASVSALLLVTAPVSAGVIRVLEGNFTAQAGAIRFSEFPVSTANPTYLPGDYGGGAGAPTVTFGGFFNGQALGTAATCPPGASITGCVVGTPSGPVLTLSSGAPATFITTDGAFPTSPTLSGTPQFNGPISMLFSVDVSGVGLQGGFFNAIGGTAIKAYDRQGNLLGQVENLATGIEFLGLVVDDGSDKIAGLQFSLVGPEPAGYNIDNLRFGTTGQVIVPNAIPEPGSFALLGGGLGALWLICRRR